MLSYQNTRNPPLDAVAVGRGPAAMFVLCVVYVLCVDMSTYDIICVYRYVYTYVYIYIYI